MTAIDTATADAPLAPRLLPTAQPALTLSTDAPSAGPIRPFGLTRTTVIDAADAGVSLKGITYNPELQLNITHDGTPLVDTPAAAQAATHQNTQHDHQWFTDKD